MESKCGFFWVSSTTTPFSGSGHMYFMCLHIPVLSKVTEHTCSYICNSAVWRGSWGCQTQLDLDYCHMSNTCITRVCTCLHENFSIYLHVDMWNTHIYSHFVFGNLKNPYFDFSYSFEWQISQQLLNMCWHRYTHEIHMPDIWLVYVDVFDILKNPYFDPSHSSIAPELKIIFSFWYFKMTPSS